MLKRVYAFFIPWIALWTLVSCSGMSGSAIVTPAKEPLPRDAEIGHSVCLGLWQCTAELGSGTLDISDLRTAGGMLNVLSFLEPPALTGMSIDFSTLQVNFTQGTVKADVILKHPIPDPAFTGFDVRGVVFGPDVTNADGYTPVMAPKYFASVPYGYIDGLLGVKNSVAKYKNEIYGFKYYCNGLGLNTDLVSFFSNPSNLPNRGAFSPAQSLSRHYDLDWNGTGYNVLVFNYAIYANYDWPVGSPPIEISDFPIATANGQEAFCCKVTETDNSLYYGGGTGGGSISLSLELWDWQGNIDNVVVKSVDPGILEATLNTPSGPGGTSYSYIYDFIDVPGNPNSSGPLDLLITATDEKRFGQSWFSGLLGPSNPLYSVKVYACWYYTTNVINCPKPDVESISPHIAHPDVVIDDAAITGTFQDGDLLGVKLVKSGEPDIIAGDVKFVDQHNITADLDLTGANGGLWDVVVTNGCGSEGTGVGLFKVLDCGTMTKIVGNGYVTTNNHMYNGTLTCTRTEPSYIIARNTSPSNYLRAMVASAPGQGDYQYEVWLPGTPQADMACDSEDTIYLVLQEYPSTLYKVGFNPSSGFGSPSIFGSIDSGISIWRIAVDQNDRPVILGATGNAGIVFHWNGTGWNQINVPSYINCGMVDFDYNPVLGQYVIVARMPLTNLYAIDADGNVVYNENDIFSFDPSYLWYPGIYIDPSDTDCHIVVWGGGLGYLPPVIRYDALYGNKTTSHGGSTMYGPSGRGGTEAPGTNRLYTSGGGGGSTTFCYFLLPGDW